MKQKILKKIEELQNSIIKLESKLSEDIHPEEKFLLVNTIIPRKRKIISSLNRALQNYQD